MEARKEMRGKHIGRKREKITREVRERKES
jgi:hypothetical protein